MWSRSFKATRIICNYPASISVRLKSQTSAWEKEYLEQMWMRRQVLGPEPLKPRSEKLNWNYDAELFAFGARLKERFNTDTLKQAFLFRSQFEKDCEARMKIVDEREPAKLELNHNESLIKKGKATVLTYVKAYLRHYHPVLPEEGIRFIVKWLCEASKLAQLSRDIGATDLICSVDFPATEETLSDIFFSIVGALETDSGIEKAERFVQDFVLTQLNDCDINEIFNIKHPKLVLERILKQQNRGDPEPRLLRQSGTFTVTPVYVVGIYSDRKLVGQSAGESISIATEMAYRESLKTIWGTDAVRRKPYDFASYASLDHLKMKENDRLSDLFSDNDGFSVTVVDPVEPEPLSVDRIVGFYKNTVERTLGVPLRKRLKHYFYYGTNRRNVGRSFLKPKVETI